MLFKFSVIVVTLVASVASAASSEIPVGNDAQALLGTHVDPPQVSALVNGTRVCPPCSPCRVDCACPSDHVPSCIKPHPNDPNGRPVCGEYSPCTSRCLCSSARAVPGRGEPTDGPPKIPDGILPPKDPLGRRVCGEYAECTPDCICSFRSVLSYLKLEGLSPKTTICAVGTCNDNCVCRETLAESLQDLLFPKAASAGGTSGAGHDEL